MNPLLTQWAIKHGVTYAALTELQRMMRVDTEPLHGNAAERSETAVQTDIRLEAAQLGMRLWRNNVGACKDETGRVIRYGLCNDSPTMNKRIKSSDLVGIRPVLITQALVGHTIGQFVAREVKKPGWRYAGTDRETAQQAFLDLVTSMGGDASFATGEGTLT